MAIKLYNTLSREIEEFKPLKDKKVGFYVCGPTVYESSHLGHARAYIVFDVIRKWLEYSRYDIKFISNLTDVHDSLIEKAAKENKTIKVIADAVIKEFYEEIKALKIKPADSYPRVSEYIPQIIEFIKVLIDKGYAYEHDQSVYFDVSKFKNYGQLSRRKLEAAKSGARIDVDKYEKEEAADFALWKRTNEKDKRASASWNSPWGEGRPGWHIECSVMSKEWLGEQFDIHAGGNDLIFPHHENEIAQSEATSGKSPFVKYWMHSGLLTVNGQKMSKSLGNFITIKDALKKYDPAVIRFWVLSAHYRSPLDYSEEALQQAGAGLDRIEEVLNKLENVKENGVDTSAEITKLIQEFNNKIQEALDDDFNTPKAIAELFNFVKETNKLMVQDKLCADDARKLRDNLMEFADLLGITRQSKPISQKIKNLMNEYLQAHNQKNYAQKDALREKLKQKGITVQDTLKEPVFKIFDKYYYKR